MKKNKPNWLVRLYPGIGDLTLVSLFTSVPNVYAISFLLLVLGAQLGNDETRMAIDASFPAACLSHFGLECLRIEHRAGWFIVCFAAFTVLFIGRETCIGLQLKNEKRELQESLSNAPSALVLETYAETYQEIEYPESADLAEVDRRIRQGLVGLVNLARAYQPSWVDNAGARYAANVMLYTNRDDIPQDRREECRARLRRFLFNPDGLDEVEGVLEIIGSLSIRVLGGTVDKDKLLGNAVLPVPVQKTATRNRDVSRVLAGAPTAYQKGTSYVRDTRRLMELYQDPERYDLPRSLADEEVRFFSNEGKSIRSLVAIRFHSTRGVKISGVVSVHYDREHLLFTETVIKNYEALALPIVRRIGNLVALRQTLTP